MKMFLNIIIKKTGNLRLNFALWLIKHISPSLNRRIIPAIECIVNIVPRPSIKEMKEVFNGKEVIGVELGVRAGFNAESILKELNVKQLHLIDIWEKEKYYQSIDMRGKTKSHRNDKNYKLLLKEYKDDLRIKIIKDYSINAVRFVDDNSLDFIYIDGAHDYDNVYNDIKIWTPKVKEGGFIAGHDIFTPLTVFNAVKDYCLKNKIVYCIRFPDWYFMKENKVVD